MRKRPKEPQAEKVGPGPMDRRQLLRLGALGVGVGILQPLGGTRAEARRLPPRPKHVSVYRLSTHGRRVCTACRAHAANHFFQTFGAADAHRAHRGCNCGIVTQRIPPGKARTYFRDGDTFDLRQAIER